MSEQVWFKPSQIVKDGMILDMNGKPNYRYVIRLIKSGELKAKVWTQQGKNTGTSVKDYYMVHRDDITAFNESR
jgi:hypothetical protein